MNIFPTPEEIAALPEKDRKVWEELAEQRRQGQERIRELILDGDYDQALALTGSEDRARLLCAWAPRLTDEEVRGLLRDWWSSTEAWSGKPELREGMMSLIKRAAQVIVLNEDSEDMLPTGYLTVFRGNLGEQPGTGSWTLDVEIAERFAQMSSSLRGMFLGMYREDGVPTVWQATVLSDKVLGYFNDRNEREIVVLVEDLEDVHAIREARA
jgi:hypothetical protein